MDTNLIALQIELTNACKLACAECPRYLMSRPVGVMKPELMKILIKDALAYKKDIGFNVNGLGEPLLYPHFAEMVDFMAAEGATRFELFTSLVAPERLVNAAFDAIQRNDKIKVQLAITKHLYDGHGKRQIVDEQFDKFLERALELHDKVDKHMGIVLTKYHTQDDITEFTERYSGFFHKDNFHIIKNLNPWFNLVQDMASLEYGSAGVSLNKHVCDYPFILLHVGWNGDVIICCTDDVDGECVLGKIEKEGDLLEVWFNDKFKEIREKHNAYIIERTDLRPVTRLLVDAENVGVREDVSPYQNALAVCNAYFKKGFHRIPVWENSLVYGTVGVSVLLVAPVFIEQGAHAWHA